MTNPGNVPALEFAGLTKSFGTNVAVDHIDLVVPPGSFFGLAGPNGAGKTTSLSMAVGLLRPDGGTVRIFGRDVWADPVAARCWRAGCSARCVAARHSRMRSCTSSAHGPAAPRADRDPGGHPVPGPAAVLAAGAAGHSPALRWLAVPVGLAWAAWLCRYSVLRAQRRLQTRGPETFARLRAS